MLVLRDVFFELSFSSQLAINTKIATSWRTGPVERFVTSTEKGCQITLLICDPDLVHRQTWWEFKLH